MRELVATLPPDLVTEAAGASAGALAALVPEAVSVLGPFAHERMTPEMERRRTFQAVAVFLATLSKRRPLRRGQARVDVRSGDVTFDALVRRRHL
jgi:hypothetical protein